MNDQLSITEIRLIRSLLTKKTNAELATITGLPVEVIEKAVTEMTGTVKRPEVEKRAAKLKQKLAEQRKRSEAKKRLDMEHARLDRLKRRMEAQKLPDKKLDLTGKVAVRLNHKTFVYVTPGTDIEALKRKLKIK